MNFQCSHCGVDHDVRGDNANNHPGGTMAHYPWYREDNGLNINATVCLRCGTVHATAGSPMKVLFSLGQRALAVRFYLPIERLKALISEKGDPLPQQVTELLVSRGFLEGAEATLSPEQEFAWQLDQAIEAAQMKYIMFCVLTQDGEFSSRTVDAFMTKAKEYEAEGLENTHTAAARVFLDVIGAGVSREAIALRAKTTYGAVK